MTLVTRLIDEVRALDYDGLLRLQRFEPAGSPYFTLSPVYEVFRQCLQEKLRGMSDEEKVAASKRVGWEPRDPKHP